MSQLASYRPRHQRRLSLAPTRRPPSSSWIRALTAAFQVERIQTENGSEFQCSIHWHVLDQVIGHVYMRPATPQLNGKVQRPHRIDAEEFSMDYSTVSSKMMPICSTRSAGSERTTTTTTALRVLGAKYPTNDCFNGPAPNLSPASVSPTAS